ncbi:hypothetical protein FHR92_004184 [Fontibacillus solani]|uniref:Uncharacterized protein n=1 Tax=Fontibacillus solani TaxID=1572857 RepID=A0A7W3SWU6_9BACL|nr:hypothetical protein [Fontibacillus solani]
MGKTRRILSKAEALIIKMRLERENGVTDITYMYYRNGQCAYLSCVKDGATKQILAYQLSSTLACHLRRGQLKSYSNDSTAIFIPKPYYIPTRVCITLTRSFGF